MQMSKLFLLQINIITWFSFVMISIFFTLVHSNFTLLNFIYPYYNACFFQYTLNKVFLSLIIFYFTYLRGSFALLYSILTLL